MIEENSLRKTLEHFLQQKQKKLDELRALELTIRQLQSELGETAQESAQAGLAVPTTTEGAMQPPPAGEKVLDVRPDVFFGMTYGQAAKAYLERVGHAVSLDELLEALRKGGCKVGGADPKRILYISLVRNTRDFVPPQSGYIGLRSFYPNLKAGVANGRQKKPRAGRRAKHRNLSKPESKRKVAPTESELGVVVRQILSDGQLHTPDSIASEAEKRLGHRVARIAVFGVLRKKGFERVDDQFRLTK